MPANLEPVAFIPDVIGVVDHPRRQPQHFSFKSDKASAFMRVLVGFVGFVRGQSLDV